MTTEARVLAVTIAVAFIAILWPAAGLALIAAAAWAGATYAVLPRRRP